ncbi:hypothetical protein OCU04_006577 [Sclerotinia nivalis]|uniref:Uncharacterized protein n=1 Tax=Sclerotinia nivalis TaxID=352851 RepID=A0A9X0AK15_9HELO|nr:hypothetical protein OCU04_006577 [Sclerotinia nivalis]
MEVPFCSDSWFAHAGRLQELAIFWELRQQHGSVSDTLFPYGITLSQPFPPPANIYCVGCDVDRTVPYVSAALRYIRKRSLERGSDLWLENFDMRYRQVSWSHGNSFVPYKYDQQAAEIRIKKLVADAQNEQSRLDEGSVPGSYQHPDGRTISGHHRPVLRGHEQHIQLLLDHGLMILPHSPDDSYINVVADTPFDLPVSQVNNPPMYFYPRPEIQDQTLLQAPVINSSQRVHPNRDLALSTENNGDAADTPMEPAGLQDISSKNNDFGGNTNSDANFKSTRPDLSPQTPSDPGRANDLSVVQHSIQHSNDSFGGSDHIFELHASFVPQITVSNTQTHETWEFGSTAEAADFLGVNHGTVVFARVSHGLIGGLYKISEADPLQLPRPKRVVVEVLNFRPDRRRLYASQGLAAQMLSFRKEEISRAIHSGRAIEEYERMYYVSYKEIAQTGHPPNLVSHQT